MGLELNQAGISLVKPKGSQLIQITIDEDINVQDIKPDIDKILQSNSMINILSNDVYDGRVIIKGEFKYQMLYLPLNDSKPVHNMTGSIPFEEIINMDGVSKKDNIKTEYTIEELKINTINTRKVSVKVLVQMKVIVDEKNDFYVPIDIIGLEDIQKKSEDVSMCRLQASKKEIYKIKDELALPSSKPNIMEILWYDKSIKNKDIRLLDDKINVKGIISLATLYLGESGENNLEFVEHEIPFNGIIECEDIREEMYSDIDMKIVDDKLQIRPDLDGEERVLAVEIVTQMDIKVYSEEDNNIITDVYSLSNELNMVKEQVEYQSLLCKNLSQCKIKETVTIEETEPNILQIYYATGDVNIDNIDILEDKLEVEGVAFCKIMYVAADDNIPINVYETILPFNQVIDAEGIKDLNNLVIRPSLNYINCTMLGEKEVEIKCSVMMDTIVFESKGLEIISGVSQEELDYKKIQDMPSVVGYIVKDQESLWDIAKHYYTKVEDIMNINQLETDQVKKGDKLIIVKNIDCMEI